jgi:hypothetical protein
MRLATFTALATALVVGPVTAAVAAPRPPEAIGYDVSYPQCGGPLPANPAFGILGVSDGLPLTDNACLAAEFAWAKGAAKAPAFYMNTANPGTASTRVDWYNQAGPRPCSTANPSGCAYDYGYNAAAHAFDYAQAQTGAAGGAWWLDVETGNSWAPDQALNVVDLSGSIDLLQARNVAVGVYSTASQWAQITGGASMAVRSWVAGAGNAKRAATMCSSSFTGGKVQFVQYPSGAYDADYAC